MGRNPLNIEQTLEQKRYKEKGGYAGFLQVAQDINMSFEEKAWQLRNKYGVSYRQAHRWLSKWQEEM